MSRRLPALTFALINAFCASASAVALTNVSFDREVLVGSPPSDTSNFTGTNLPAFGEATAIAPGGDKIIADYDFTDAGVLGHFHIQTEYSFVGIDNVTELGSDNGGGTIAFTTPNVPVRFTLSASNSAIGAVSDMDMQVLIQGYTVIGNFYSMVLHDSGIGFHASGVNPHTEIPMVTGLLDMNTTYYVSVDSGAASQSPGLPVSGTSNFDLVLTAVPEPSTAVLLAVGAMAILAQHIRLRGSSRAR